MKRIVAAGIGLLAPFVLAGVAFAQDGSGLGPPEGPQISGAGGSIGDAGGVGGSAFTGVQVAGLMLAAVALVAIGLTLVLMTRRRRAAEAVR